jgi:hypothetical protein
MNKEKEKKRKEQEGGKYTKGRKGREGKKVWGLGMGRGRVNKKVCKNGNNERVKCIKKAEYIFPPLFCLYSSSPDIIR